MLIDSIVAEGLRSSGDEHASSPEAAGAEQDMEPGGGSRHDRRLAAKRTDAERIRATARYDGTAALNKRKNQVKLIVWTRGGFTIVHKRLERGTFTFPARVAENVPSVAIDVHELAMLLEGIEVAHAKTKPRWEPPARVRSSATNDR